MIFKEEQNTFDGILYIIIVAAFGLAVLVVNEFFNDGHFINNMNLIFIIFAVIVIKNALTTVNNLVSNQKHDRQDPQLAIVGLESNQEITWSCRYDNHCC